MSSSPSEFSRQEWIDACHFHDLTEEQVLHEVAERVSRIKAAAAGRRRQAHPLVLLDLDSTLYEVGPRTLRIIQEWVETAESADTPSVRAALQRLDVKQVGYSIFDTFKTIGLRVDSPEAEKAAKRLKAFWAARFFTSEYLQYDRAYPGAASFTRKLHGLGAEIVYLTGRDEPGMGDGTRANLIRDGFPWETERTHLLLKAAPEIPDITHKREAADYIRQHGTLVASFENEPPNIVALYEIFPEAMHVFVDTVCSDHLAGVRQGLYRIRHFGE